MDFVKSAQNAQRLIRKNGRPLQFYKIGDSIADPTKPWRGAGAPIDTGLVEEFGVFAIGNTSIPTESRGLAFDWVDSELLRTARHVCLIPALDLPPMEEYKTIIDTTQNNERWNIIWGQCLQPGEQRLLYCFGLKQ